MFIARRLKDLVRAEEVGDLPERLNRRTATSAVAPHSKSSLSLIRRAALGDTTGDARRNRSSAPASPGLRFARGVRAIEAREVASLLGEVAVTERAFLAPPEGWLGVHVPGWDTATVQLFLERLPEAPVVRFGDLDPAGVRIYRHLRRLHPGLL